MKIRILKSVPASRDGMKVEEFHAASIELINEAAPREVELAELLVREGLAEIVTDAEAAAHEAQSAEDRAAFLKGLEVKDAEDRSKLEKKTGKRGKKVEPPAPPPPAPPPPAPTPPKADPIVPPAPPPEPSPIPQADTIKVGSVVLYVERLGQRMTVVKLEGDTAECAWFEGSTARADLFTVASLVNAPVAES